MAYYILLGWWYCIGCLQTIPYISIAISVVGVLSVFQAWFFSSWETHISSRNSREREMLSMPVFFILSILHFGGWVSPQCLNLKLANPTGVGRWCFEFTYPLKGQLSELQTWAWLQLLWITVMLNSMLCRSFSSRKMLQRTSVSCNFTFFIKLKEESLQAIIHLSSKLLSEQKCVHTRHTCTTQSLAAFGCLLTTLLLANICSCRK